jgi:integrase/recombinase XerD
VIVSSLTPFSRGPWRVGDCRIPAGDGRCPADERSLPAEARGEVLVDARLRPRHRLREPERRVEAISDEDILELLRACRNARDRFIVLALWRMGLRRGELAGLRREDVHLVPDATRLGCG